MFMKKLIIIITMFLFGCSTELKPVENPEKKTTLEILENTKTGQYSIVDGKVYIIENDKVKYVSFSNGNVSTSLLIGIIIGFAIGILIAIVTND